MKIDLLAHDDDCIVARVNDRVVHVKSRGDGVAMVEGGAKAVPSNARWVLVSIERTSLELDVCEATAGQDPQSVLRELATRHRDRFV